VNSGNTPGFAGKHGIKRLKLMIGCNNGIKLLDNREFADIDQKKQEY
jgi:hypothetical protein